MKNITIPPTPLKGQIIIPPSKSLCHRAIIAASLGDGVSLIHRVILSDDIQATWEGMENLGALIEKQGESLRIKGADFVSPARDTIDCIESGSTLRFLIPIALLQEKEVTFVGKGRLGERPLSPYYDIFEKQGIYYNNPKGLPLTLKGRLKPGRFELAGNISSQFITGLLFALPTLEGDSEIHINTELESKSYVDLTLDILDKFSIKIENNHYKTFYIKGNQQYKSTDYTVEGDFSQAAFWLAAGVLGGDISCMGLHGDSLQGDKAIVDIITQMGGNLTVEEDCIRAAASKTSGITIDASQCPDIVPVLAVLGALSEGTTKIVNAQRVRIKESDRLKAIATELSKLGAHISELEDGLVIQGKPMLEGGTVESWGDHRIAMALAVASVRCKSPVIIQNSGVVNKSYPHFFEDFKALEGIADELYLGE